MCNTSLQPDKWRLKSDNGKAADCKTFHRHVQLNAVKEALLLVFLFVFFYNSLIHFNSISVTALLLCVCVVPSVECTLQPFSCLYPSQIPEKLMPQHAAPVPQRTHLKDDVSRMCIRRKSTIPNKRKHVL